MEGLCFLPDDEWVGLFFLLLPPPLFFLPDFGFLLLPPPLFFLVGCLVVPLFFFFFVGFFLLPPPLFFLGLVGFVFFFLPPEPFPFPFFFFFLPPPPPWPGGSVGNNMVSARLGFKEGGTVEGGDDDFGFLV